jgi:hypothetical protein
MVDREFEQDVMTSISSARTWARPRAIDAFSVLIAVVALGSVGCRKHAEPKQETAAATVSAPPSSTRPAPRIKTTPSGQSYVEGLAPEVFHIPVGPRLGIVPGKGLGPVRFGATPETVERLLEGKCSIKTPTECRILSHAVDFTFKDGVVEEMRVHGEERPFMDSSTDTYGIFNGRFLKGAQLGMYAQFVQETLGEPKRVEKFETPPPGRYATVERHYYDDMVLEYDRLKNNNVVLAGVILTRPAPGSVNPLGDESEPEPSTKPAGSTKPGGSTKAAPGSKPAPNKTPTTTPKSPN